jgi:hypothetical protein
VRIKNNCLGDAGLFARFYAGGCSMAKEGAMNK